jgi:hypothetical protein
MVFKYPEKIWKSMKLVQKKVGCMREEVINFPWPFSLFLQVVPFSGVH